MSATSAVGAFSDAVLARLKADAGVKAIVSSKVFDVVPAKQQAPIVPPWIYLGPAGTKRLENDCYRGWEIRLRIFCAADGFGRNGVWSMAEAVDLALDDTMLELAPGFTLAAALKMVEGGDLIDPTKLRAVFTDVVGLVYRDAPLVAAS